MAVEKNPFSELLIQSEHLPRSMETNDLTK